MRRRLVQAILVLSLCVPAVAAAQSDSAPRDVVKGGYAKMAIGYNGWFTTPYVNYGVNFNFGGGYDIVDQLLYTISAEGALYMATVQGKSGASLNAQGTSPVQGDFQSLGGIVSVKGAYNFGGREVKRLSVYLRVGGGVWFSPAARDIGDDDNPANLNTSFGVSPHGRAIPAVDANIGFEYFTRLAHFSVGVEAGMLGLIGAQPISSFVPTININVIIKYTFGKPQKKA